MPKPAAKSPTLAAFDRALASAESSWKRQENAARHCVGGEKRKAELLASAARLHAQYEELRRARAFLVDPAMTLNLAELQQLCILRMVADPLPYNVDPQVVDDFFQRASQAHGFESWIEVYHLHGEAQRYGAKQA